uniref:CSON004182 protein n=1 Tax=Culicoides sonorensis TaxID=179676 RepID=A0A336LX30_CULSO
MFTNINVLLMICFIVILFMNHINDKIQTIKSLHSNDTKLLNHIKKLMILQSEPSSMSETAKAIILRQSLMNVIETQNSSYMLPIPMNERKRIVIFSPSRSSFTFIEDIFNNLPATYQHYEPFNYHGIDQIETQPWVIDHVTDLLKCNYGSMSTIQHMLVSEHWHHNDHFAQYCDEEQEVLCRSVTFREAFCNIFPRQTMKVVRASLSLAEFLLKDSELNVNVVFQIRDPRALILSRQTFTGCETHPDCFSISEYCKILKDNYLTAISIFRKYPTRFKVVRFEDFVTNPFGVTLDIFNQFGIPFDEKTQNFLIDHTNSMSSTNQISKNVINKWIQSSNMTEIEKIQSECFEAMNYWGYNLIEDPTQFNPEIFKSVDSKLIVSIPIFIIAFIFLLKLLHNVFYEDQKISVNNTELLLMAAERFLAIQTDLKVGNGTERSVIWRQSMLNFIETGNATLLLPIPSNEVNRILIFSSWRSGSTFIGDIFNNIPATYYHFEPFNYVGMHQVETNETSIDHVKSLLKCNHGTVTTRKHMDMYYHWFFNLHLREYCGNIHKWESSICREVSFRDAFCTIFPRQVMKFVRARITLAEDLITDNELNVNVILQVRDPRAVFHSRKTFPNCNLHHDCFSMEFYCGLLVQDYHEAKVMLEKYPTRFKVLRFEDLAMNPFEITQDMFNKFGISFDDRIRQFLEKHTHTNQTKMFSTFRNSKEVISNWMKDLSFKEVSEIQSHCVEAMKLWGYKPIQVESDLNSTIFDPTSVSFYLPLALSLGQLHCKTGFHITTIITLKHSIKV